MPELADDISWAQDYDVGVQIDSDEDMDEGVMQRGIRAFYFPTRVIEWVGKLPAKMERDCSCALSENIMEAEENGLAVSLVLLFGVPSPGSIICQMGGIATFLSPSKFSSLRRRRTENRRKGGRKYLSKRVAFRGYSIALVFNPIFRCKPSSLERGWLLKWS